MAARFVERLQPMVECRVCLKTLTKPTVLQCLHYFCKDCVSNLTPGKQGHLEGHICPMCRQFTADDQLRPMFLINELLEVASLAKKQLDPCDRCQAERPTWRCSDCKDNFCDVCKNSHDGFSLFNKHHVTALCEADSQVEDKHMFCAKHPGEVVKLYCRDCKQLTCSLCNGTAHKQHEAQTIAQALREISPVIAENQRAIERVVKITETQLCDVKNVIANVTKGYDALEKEADAKYDEIVTKAQQDRDATKRQLATIKAAQMTEYSDAISYLEMKLKSHQNVVYLTKRTLRTARDVSLLHAIHSGLSESLASHAKAKPLHLQYSDKPKATLNLAVNARHNVIGTVKP